MNKTILIVTVFVEKDHVTCECVCPIPDVKTGDLVKIFLNNAPVTGQVKAVKEVPLSELSDDIYEMKSVIEKVRGSVTIEAEMNNTIRVSTFSEKSRRVTMIGHGYYCCLAFDWAELEVNGAEIGDTLLFVDKDRKPYTSVIIGIDPLEFTPLLEYHVSAVIKKPKDAEFLTNTLKFDSEKHRVTLLSFKLPYDEYKIDSIVTNIGSRSFERCRKLKNLTIATSGITIEPMAFAYNDSLEEIHILDENADIAVNCFDGCRDLKRVILPYTKFHLRYELAEYYGDRIKFIYFLGKNHLVNGIVYSPDYKKIICCTTEEIKKFQTPTYVEEIYYKAFLNCKKLEWYSASPLMENAGVSILEGCMALKQVYARFENEVDTVLLFGQTYCENSKPMELTRKDGSDVTFYLPQKCEFTNIPSAEVLVKSLNPRELQPSVCSQLGEYFYKRHNTKEAIRFHSAAAHRGIDKSYQRLAAYSYVGGPVQQYFTVDEYEYAHRQQAIRPFFQMLAMDYPSYQFEGIPEKDILNHFSDRSNLVCLLKTISSTKIYDLDLLAITLDRLFKQTEDIHDLELKRLFLRCILKLGQFPHRLDYKRELLDALFQNGDEKDFREFGFEIIAPNKFLPCQEKDLFLSTMPDSETKECLLLARAASLTPVPENIVVFEHFLQQYTETGDLFYQKCAVVSVYSYLAYCWREKSYAAQFRSTLELIVQRYDEGFYLLGELILNFKQNMKRNIPKRYYLKCAEQMYDAGRLCENIFNNIIGRETVGQYAQPKAAYYARYPEYFTTKDRHTFIMEEFQTSRYYIPGSIVIRPESKQEYPLMYKNYLPELTGGELIIFLNPHEGLTYAEKNNLPIPDDYYSITLGQILSVMNYYHISEARVFPQILNKIITEEYIKSVFNEE